mgnify:FL=1
MERAGELIDLRDGDGLLKVQRKRRVGAKDLAGRDLAVLLGLGLLSTIKRWQIITQVELAVPR